MTMRSDADCALEEEREERRGEERWSGLRVRLTLWCVRECVCAGNAMVKWKRSPDGRRSKDARGERRGVEWVAAMRRRPTTSDDIRECECEEMARRGQRRSAACLLA